jgi:hypothetical protein
MSVPTQVSVRQSKGLVGFFDILGYQNFVDNNDVEEGVKSVIEALEVMPKSVQEVAEKLLIKFDENTRETLAETQSLVFSDTIVLACPVDGNDTPRRQYARWMNFLIQAAILQRKMFHFGFPIRGAISFGAFMTGKSCFAGRAIIEAYKQTNKLDLAGVAFTDSGRKEMERLLTQTPDTGTRKFAGLAVEYLVPVKEGEQVRRWTVNFAELFVPAAFPDLSGDARKLVSDCFWRHNKDIPQSALSKLTNTELLLRYYQHCASQVPS